MGGKCPHRRVKKRRLANKSARRAKFLVKDILSLCLNFLYIPFFVYLNDPIRDDAVYEDLQKPEDERKPLPIDEDLPGMGQFYCLHCDRYFANISIRDEHFQTKRHKKKVKQMQGPAPHTQLDAEIAAGMGMPDNGPKLQDTIFSMSL